MDLAHFYAVNSLELYPITNKATKFFVIFFFFQFCPSPFIAWRSVDQTNASHHSPQNFHLTIYLLIEKWFEGELYIMLNFRFYTRKLNVLKSNENSNVKCGRQVRRLNISTYVFPFFFFLLLPLLVLLYFFRLLLHSFERLCMCVVFPCGKLWEKNAEKKPTKTKTTTWMLNEW